MTIKGVVFLLIALAIIIVYIIIAIYALKRRNNAGATALAALMLGAAGYAVPYILGLCSKDLNTALFFYNISLPGASIIGPVWFAFALQYRRQKVSLPLSIIVLLGLIPAVSCVMAWTNSLHYLYGTRFQFDPKAVFSVLEWDFGLFYWINLTYSYFMVTVGTIYLLSSVVKRFRFYNNQTILILIGIIFPFIFNVSFVAGYSPIHNLDLTPFTFLITGISWSLAIFRYDFLEISPIAHNLIIDAMPLGVIIIDKSGRVVDLNLISQSLIDHLSEAVIGEKIDQISPFSDHKLFIQEVIERNGSDICIHKIDDAGYLEVKSAPIFRKEKQRYGTLLLIQDVSSRKLTEISEHEQRILAEALRDTASDINRTLDIEETLNLILQNLCKVILNDDAHIILLQPLINDDIQKIRCGDFSISLCVDKVTPIFPHVHECADSLIEEILIHEQPKIIRDTDHYSDWKDCCGRDWVRSVIGIPIIVNERLRGLILAESATPETFSENTIEQLSAFAYQTAMAIEKNDLYVELQKKATHDDLTGLLNRRGLFEFGQHEIERSQRNQKSLGVIIFDIDDFKNINDSYGHGVGDEVLCRVAKLCRDVVRKVDVVGRYGGDEFIVMLPDSNIQITKRVGERIRRTIERCKIIMDETELTITVSLGVVVDSSNTLSLDELLKEADRALYEAKATGKNVLRPSALLERI